MSKIEIKKLSIIYDSSSDFNKKKFELKLPELDIRIFLAKWDTFVVINVGVHSNSRFAIIQSLCTWKMKLQEDAANQSIKFVSNQIEKLNIQSELHKMHTEVLQ